MTQEIQASLFQLTKVNISTRLSDCVQRFQFSAAAFSFTRRGFCFYGVASVFQKGSECFLKCAQQKPHVLSGDVSQHHESLSSAHVMMMMMMRRLMLGLNVSEANSRCDILNQICPVVLMTDFPPDRSCAVTPN